MNVVTLDRHMGRMAVTLLAMGVMMVCLAACSPRKAARPAVAPAVPIQLTLDYHAGTILSGPTDKAIDFAQATVGPAYKLAGIAFEDLALAQSLLGTGQPLPSRASVITSSRSPDGVVAASTLLRDVRLIDGPSAADVWRLPTQGGDVADPAAWPRWAQSHPLEGLLVADAVMRVDFDLIGKLDQPGPRRLTVWLHPVPGDFGHPSQVRLGVTLQARQPRRGPTAGQGTPGPMSPLPASTTWRQETAILELPVPDAQQPIILLLPFEMPDSPWSALAVVLHAVADDEVSPAAREMMVTQAAKALADARQAVVEQPVAPPAAFASSQAELAGLVALLGEPGRQRGALLLLAERTGATFLADLALVGDDLFVELLAGRARQGLTQTPLPGVTMGWVLDRAGFELVVAQLEQRSLPELSGVLATHLGDIARRPVMLEELLDALRTRQTFETRLLAENYLSLEDDAPSARVRAWQWLKARALEPAGYDPLASDDDRRAALEKAAEKAAAQAADKAAAATSQADTTKQGSPQR